MTTVALFAAVLQVLSSMDLLIVYGLGVVVGCFCPATAWREDHPSAAADDTGADIDDDVDQWRWDELADAAEEMVAAPASAHARHRLERALEGLA